jgi:hypothetical protein
MSAAVGRVEPFRAIAPACAPAAWACSERGPSFHAGPSWVVDGRNDRQMSQARDDLAMTAQGVAGLVTTSQGLAQGRAQPFRAITTARALVAGSVAIQGRCDRLDHQLTGGGCPQRGGCPEPLWPTNVRRLAEAAIPAFGSPSGFDPSRKSGSNRRGSDIILIFRPPTPSNSRWIVL